MVKVWSCFSGLGCCVIGFILGSGYQYYELGSMFLISGLVLFIIIPFMIISPILYFRKLKEKRQNEVN